MMTLITEEQLLAYNEEGIIPSPDETEEAFINRGEYCKNLSRLIAGSLGDKIPFSIGASANADCLQEAFVHTRPLFDIAPSWIPIFFSNHRLAPWHGGCAWIFQMEKNGPTSAFMQLRKNFQTKHRYLGTYSRSELLSHELSHVGRMLFEEPRYEELLAYRTSPSRFRRFFGPLVQSSRESLLFVFIILLIFASDAYLLGEGLYADYILAMWAKMIPSGLAALALARLWKRQHRFKTCLDKLRSLTGNEKIANAVIYRLRDCEIELFSHLSSDEIAAYAKDHRSKSLRWRLIDIAYLNRLDKTP